MNSSQACNTAPLAALRQRRDTAFAKKGLGLALFSGIGWGFDSVLLSLSFAATVLTEEAYWLLAPLTVGALHDLFSAMWLLLINTATGRNRELVRTMRSKIARPVILGALFGGPMAMSFYMLGVKFAGPAYVIPITALYPAVASVLAAIFLKERILPRAWAGLALCVVGGVVIGYTPPEGALGSDFYLGIGCALLATIGWGLEGVLATSGMDLLDPAVALNVRQLTSASAYLLAILPLAGGYVLLGPALTDISINWIFPTAALAGALAYLCWYRAMNMTGVSRAMAINITYSLWGILFSALFTEVDITSNIIIGALLITTGMVMVVGDPREMASLRNVV
ncbi:EamA family transporter [Pseudodesulfovibrio cashew]|uniref:EamA family transporter n=1 Tax=Pseudodesulfovibrio cashew TaxID=2678688 RepID=A0A6I6JL07_9BACT|nr:DMT family transporter [Pseudodesulfovibrio cashew]QGY41879.1 EamA family transporter [Pseudodesulfovibrio cashew]